MKLTDDACNEALRIETEMLAHEDVMNMLIYSLKDTLMVQAKEEKRPLWYRLGLVGRWCYLYGFRCGLEMAQLMQDDENAAQCATSTKTLTKIADALSVSVDDLFEDGD